MIAELNLSHERYKLLCHKITCVALSTAAERSLCADDLLDYYLFKLMQGERVVCWVSKVDFY